MGGEPETKATAQDANDNTNLIFGDKSYEDDGDDQHGQAEEEIGWKGFDGDAKGAGHEGFLGAHLGGGGAGGLSLARGWTFHRRIKNATSIMELTSTVRIEAAVAKLLNAVPPPFT